MLRRLVNTAFPPFDFGWRLRTRRIERDGVRISWLGVACCLIEYDGQRLLVDPFVTRPRLGAVLTGRLSPNEAVVDRWIPSVDGVVVGHSHYDHILDAGYVSRRDQSPVVGSRSTANVMRAAGVSEELLRIAPPEGATFDLGVFKVTLIPSRHCRLMFGREPFPGEISTSIKLPARSSAYRSGTVYGVLVEVGGLSIYHNGSADLLDDALTGTRADIALVGMAGASSTERYFDRLLDALNPSVVVPIHFDAFFSPLSDGLRLLPNVDFGECFTRVKTREREIDLLIPVWSDDQLRP